MTTLVALTVGLVAWIVLWAIGVKSFDAFLITILMVVVAGMAHTLAPFLPGNRSSDDS
jgi:predicted PurR-regulated permease PerM